MFARKLNFKLAGGALIEKNWRKKCRAAAICRSGRLNAANEFVKYLYGNPTKIARWPSKSEFSRVGHPARERKKHAPIYTSRPLSRHCRTLFSRENKKKNEFSLQLV